jgi:hypothetical protein
MTIRRRGKSHDYGNPTTLPQMPERMRGPICGAAQSFLASSPCQACISLKFNEQRGNGFVGAELLNEIPRMVQPMQNRRLILTGAAAVPALLALTACGKGEEEDVGAVEDLMREHGILRRAILIFREAAARLRQDVAVDPSALTQTAQLFRSFGEEYHERKLEEAYIFPAVQKVGGESGSYVQTLIDQHNRGREIIDYVLRNASSISSRKALSQSLEQFE